MADHDSTLRLNLAAAGMLSMLQTLEKQSGELAKEIGDIGKESQKTEKKMHPMLESGKKGLGAAKTAAGELGGALKSALGVAVTLGGTLSLMGGVDTATMLQSKYKDIAFNIRTSTDEAVRWQDVQKHVEQTADRWSQSNEGVAQSFDEIFAKTKDLNFAKKASDEAAKAAAATGRPLEVMSKLAEDLGDKFSISADEIGDAMASVISTGRAQELAENMHEIGAAARGMGLEGKEGLDRYIGLLEVAKKSMKDIPTAIAAMQGLSEPLQNLEATKDIERKLKVKLRTDDGQLRDDALEQIIGATGGQTEELSRVFSGDTLKLVTEFGRVYQKGFDEVSGSFKDKSAAGMEAFHKALMDSLPDSEKTKKDIQKEAEDRQDDPREQLRRSVQRVTNAFAQPKMIDAIDKIADKLPALADSLAGFLEFAADHPLLTGAGILAAKPGMAFGQSLAADGVSALSKKAFDAAKGTAMGQKIGATIATTAASSGKWASVAGKGLGVAAAGVIAFAVGKAIIDSRLAANKQKQDGALSAGIGARQAALSGDDSKMREARAKLVDKIDRLEKQDQGVGGLGEKFMLGLSRLTTGDLNMRSGNQIAKKEAERELKLLEEAISKGSEKGGDHMKDAAKEMKSAARALKAATPRAGSGGDGTNGLPAGPGS